MESAPTMQNPTSCRASPPGTPLSARSRGSSPKGRASRSSGSAPTASARPTRHTPFRSSVAVRTMWTVESGSSTQSTGTSWMRSPARSASTSSSVSKNHPESSTIGSSRSATSRRMALNPHCASLNRAASDERRMRL